MISIVRATLKDVNLLTNLGKTTFLEAHGRSASEENINIYISKKFTNQACEEELKDTNNIFYLLKCTLLGILQIKCGFFLNIIYVGTNFINLNVMGDLVFGINDRSPDWVHNCA